MVTKYRADEYPPRIYAVEVERETDASVWVRGRKRPKTSYHGVFRDTWEEAHAFLMDLARKNLEGSQRELDRNRSYFERIKAMKP